MPETHENELRRATRHRFKATRWHIAILLGVGVLINYFDRVNLSVSQPALQHGFGIDNVTFGYLLSAYNLPYALCQLPMGALLDRFGVRRITRAATLLWSAASFAASAALNLPMFFAARLLLGVGESPFFPANAKAIGQWFPPHERSFPTSLFDSAAKFSSAIGVPVIGVLVLRLGWRMAFAATGLISLAYFLAFFLIYRDPEPEARWDAVEEIRQQSEPVPEPPSSSRSAAETRLTFTELLRQRKVLGLTIGFGAYNYVFYLLLTWLPSYLYQALHIDLLHSFFYSSVPWLVATIADLLIGGWLVDALIRRGLNASRVRMTILVGGTVLGLGIFCAAFAHSRFEALAWISVSIGGLSAAAPVGWSAPSLIVHGDNVGSVGGIVNFSNQISGLLAPIITGYAVTWTHSFAVAFYVAAAYLVLGILAYLFLLREIVLVPMPVRTASEHFQP